jgi:Arc/MetJ family transcription regulator
MRTNIVLDDALVDRAMELTGARTKREVVHRALSDLVERRTRKNLLDLAGEVDFAPDFDHKALRELRVIPHRGDR